VPPALEPRDGVPNSCPCPRPATLTQSADAFYPPFLKGTSAINKSGRRTLTQVLHKFDRHVGSNIYCTAHVGMGQHHPSRGAVWPERSEFLPKST
jgi:hypothetical protein